MPHTDRDFSHIIDLAEPWSKQPYGPWALAGVALLLILLTVWTYSGVKGATFRRVLVVLVLRLAALALACTMIVRPALEVKELTYVPGRLLVVYDRSQSMTIRDEFDNKSRWEAMQYYFKTEPKAKERFDELERKNVSVTEYHFDADLRPFDADAKPEGVRTDVGRALNSLYKLHLTDQDLLGVVLVSDGTVYGTQFPEMVEAERLGKLPCKVYTVGLGKPTTFEGRRDVAFTNIVVDPTPVPVKGKMTVRGTIDAPGFENATITVRLKIDGKEVLASQETLRNKAANEVTLVTDAPTTPGEVMVTLSSDPLPGELTESNNTISTYATVTKEGISVLLVDRLRLEQKFIRHALESDPRFRLYVSWRVNDATPAGIDLFQFNERQYDVIIIGDVTPQLFEAGNAGALEKVRELVGKGSGLMLMGGRDAFGNGGWARSPIGPILPVTADVRGQADVKFRMEPTAKGLEKIIMRLKDRPPENKALWEALPKLDGYTQMGQPKAAAAIYATKEATGEPLLVFGTEGEGRVLAFAGDTTWRWLRYGQPKKNDGIDAHARFWRQLVLFLAKQDEAEGSAWVKPETRRLAAGSKLGFTVGLRGKGGLDLKDARFQVKVRNPQGAEVPTDTAREQDADRGSFWKTDAPGEYRIEVTARGKDADGTEATGKASARFLVYQDDAEMSRRAANHDFLIQLARYGGGKFFPAQDLPQFFDELDRQSVDRSAHKTERWPDWHRERAPSAFLSAAFLGFTGLLCLEWLLRRRWGLV